MRKQATAERYKEQKDWNEMVASLSGKAKELFEQGAMMANKGGFNAACCRKNSRAQKSALEMMARGDALIDKAFEMQEAKAKK